MKQYSTIILIISAIYGWIVGLTNWIGNLSDALYYKETLSFVIQFIFWQILIPINGLFAFLVAFVILFIIGLPIYGIYSLFKNKE